MIHNVDTLAITFDINAYETSTEKLRSILLEKKEGARTKEFEFDKKEITITIDDVTFKVMPNGTSCHAYVLHNDDMELCLSNFRSKNENNYPVKVRFKQEYLWSKGYLKAYKQVTGFIERNIGKIIKNKVSRVDLCCHTDTISHPNLVECFFGKFRNVQVYYFDRKLTSVTFGSRGSSIYCRIYNKSHEIEVKKKGSYFHKIWTKKGMDINNVWNVEFELKREILKEMKIETLEDLTQNIRKIWNYLTELWINSTLECWEKVQKGFLNSEDGYIERYKQEESDIEPLVAQAVGLLTTIGSKLEVEDEEYIFNYFNDSMNKYFEKKGKTFDDEVSKKMNLIYNDLNPKARIYIDETIPF